MFQALCEGQGTDVCSSDLVTGAAQELQSEEQVIQWEGVKTMIWGWCIGAPGPVQAEAGGEARQRKAEAVWDEMGSVLLSLC